MGDKIKANSNIKCVSTQSHAQRNASLCLWMVSNGTPRFSSICRFDDVGRDQLVTPPTDVPRSPTGLRSGDSEYNSIYIICILINQSILL